MSELGSEDAAALIAVEAIVQDVSVVDAEVAVSGTVEPERRFIDESGEYHPLKTERSLSHEYNL